MKKYFISSDIHGFFSYWQEALIAKGFDVSNPEHVIVVCGDLLDRGLEAKKTVEFAYNLFKQNRFIFIDGNHEGLFTTMVKNHEITKWDISNGTYGTLLQLAKEPELVSFNFLYDPRWDELRASAINFFETEKYIFVHGWIPMIECDNLPVYYAKNRKFKYDKNWRNADESHWETAKWANGMEAWHNGILEEGKTIICGHWHCSWGWSHLKNKYKEFPQQNHEDFNYSFLPFADKGILAIDGCTAYSHKVNVVVLDEDEL